MNKKQLFASMSLAAAIGIASMQPEVYTFIEKQIPWTERGKQHAIQKQFARTVEDAIKGLTTDEEYIVIAGGPWCLPCRNLEEAWVSEGLPPPDAHITIDNNHLTEQLRYTEMAFQRANLPPPQIFPTIYIRSHGSVLRYNGFASQSTYTPNGEAIPLEKLVKK